MFSSGGKAPEFHPSGELFHTSDEQNINMENLDPEYMARLMDVVKEGFFRTGVTSDFDSKRCGQNIIFECSYNNEKNIARFSVRKENIRMADPYIFE